jgi:hypothetical protein
MAELKHVHFTLNPNNTRDSKAINILEQLPERQTKNFFLSLLENRSDMAQIAQEVHALAVHFGVSVEARAVEVTPLPVQQNRQLDGQLGVEDLQMGTEVNDDTDFEISAQAVSDIDAGDDDSQENDELPEGVMDFISGMSDWGG